MSMHDLSWPFLHNFADQTKFWSHFVLFSAQRDLLLFIIWCWVTQLYISRCAIPAEWLSTIVTRSPLRLQSHFPLLSVLYVTASGTVPVSTVCIWWVQYKYETSLSSARSLRVWVRKEACKRRGDEQRKKEAENGGKNDEWKLKKKEEETTRAVD